MHIFLLWITHFSLFNCCKYFLFSPICTKYSVVNVHVLHLPSIRHAIFIFDGIKEKISRIFLLGKAIEMSILYWNKSYPFKTAPYYIPIILSVLIPFCIICCILCNHHALIQCIPFCIKPPHKGFFFQYRILWNWNHITGQNLITFVTVRIR